MVGVMFQLQDGCMRSSGRTSELTWGLGGHGVAGGSEGEE